MSQPFHPENPARFESACRRFDEENARDPNRVESGGVQQPRELVYAHWLTGWVERLRPEASEELRLAACSQHLCRWEIPRDAYPMTRAGYLKWREELRRFHARKTGDILRETGYPEPIITRVQELNLKKLFPQDPETRILEDALCLVFLEHQFAELAAKTTEEKIINAVQKTWKKMSTRAQNLALGLPLGPAEKALIQKALG